ncbi:hypothetical protein FTX61_12455 [Nitriliruptoraceae bacterium ZYF776]|nr:hypothetical protein [Profundirhabdus halotolerans]
MPTRRPRTLVARLVAAVVLVLLAGCRGGDADEAPPTTVSLADLEVAVSAVAEEQREADAAVADHLAAVRDVDQVLRQVVDEVTVDVGLAAVAEAASALDQLDPELTREQLRELAARVDRARRQLAEVRPTAAPEVRDYLDAEDEVLLAVRDHAEAGDAIAQLVERHRPGYLAALGTLDAVAERREDLRDPAEAAAAVEVALAPHVRPIELAQGQLEPFRRERDATGRAVNEAAADATAAFERLPPSGP